MVFGLPIDDVTFAIILSCIVGLLTGAFLYFVVSWVPNHTGNFRFCDIFDERDGKFFLLKTVRVGLGKLSFVLGKDYQFVVPTPAPALFYRNGRPVLQYVLSKARPRLVEMEDGKTVESQVKPTKVVHPEKVAVKAPKNVKDVKSGEKLKPGEAPDAESRSVNMFYRRGAFEQMLRATRNVSFKDVLPLLIIILITGVMVGYVVFLSFHPGMVAAPPAGYFYKACPIPTNATATGGVSGALGCGP